MSGVCKNYLKYVFILCLLLKCVGCSGGGNSGTAVQDDSSNRGSDAPGQIDVGIADSNEIEGIGTVKPLDMSSVRSDPDTSLEYVSDQILVTFSEGTSRQKAASIIASIGGRIVGELKGLDDYQVELDDFYTLDDIYMLAERIRQNPAVVAAGPNLVMFKETGSPALIHLPPNDPWYSVNCFDLPLELGDPICIWTEKWDSQPKGRNWGWEMIHAQQGWGRISDYLKNGGEGSQLHQVNVGIIESVGFANNYKEELPFEALGSVYALVNKGVEEAGLNPNNKCPEKDIPEEEFYICKVINDGGKGTVNREKLTKPACDTGKHGMEVAGVIGARFNNGKGIAGVAINPSMFGFRYEQSFDVKIGILWLAKHGVRVINMSFGQYWRNPLDKTAGCRVTAGTAEKKKFVDSQRSMWSTFLEKIERKGIHLLYVKAAGNENIPARYIGGVGSLNEEERRRHGVLVVGALAYNSNPIKAKLSNYGDVDIFAPGENIYSIGTKRKVVGDQGTSLAAPFVTGVAAELFSINPCLTPGQVRDYLLEGAADQKVLFDGKSYPVLDMDKSIKLAINDIKSMPCNDYDSGDGQSAASEMLSDMLKQLVPVVVEVKATNRVDQDGKAKGIKDAQIMLLLHRSPDADVANDPGGNSLALATDSSGVAMALVRPGNYDIYAASPICHGTSGETLAKQTVNVIAGDSKNNPVKVEIYLECFNYTISGYVKDRDTGRPIEDAKVIFQYGDKGVQYTSTTFSGWYHIGVMNSVDHAVLAVVAQGYRYQTISFGRNDFLYNDQHHVERNVQLRKADDRYIPVSEGWGVYHLGDDYYEGSVNSQFQKESIGLKKAFEFFVEQGPVLGADILKINFKAKGVQGDFAYNSVSINNKVVGYLPSSPQDGSYEEVTLSIPLSEVDLSYNNMNTLAFKSAQNVFNANDHDDFEITNIYLELAKRQRPVYGEVSP